ncbi:hypothetical protein HAX54_039520 [Datura stramonium]|uniref:Putative plant transposon protein domain-containing protein n=1 Tax=Datura stramonium TaxID=4076 RepID=A0ABS8SJ44_DATST|nr:hypothetical protein [Datura stramonium]
MMQRREMIDNEKFGDDDNEAEESGEKWKLAEESDDKESAAEKSSEQEEDSDPPTTPDMRTKRWTIQGCWDFYYAGLALNEKGNPNRSIQEDPWIQNNALNKVSELKRLFEAYNMHWMDETPGTYSMEMVHEFYANYYYTLEENAPSRSVIKKELELDSIWVRAIPVDISERTITRVLMGGDYTMPTSTIEWMANIIVEDKEEAEWVMGRKPIYKASLNILAKSWCSIVLYWLTPILNDNVLRVD